ncbi:MAG TPA: hypothetical protein VHZ51_10215 [Ktedonobacteraceae bacterium]|jgi:hypothetical protein|nr:hypothetical protein [Ktedonobacteraceae bacterium]
MQDDHKDNHDEQRDDEVAEISDLPQEEQTPFASKRSPTRFSNTLLSYFDWSHRHRRASLLLSIGLVALTVLIILGSLRPFQSLQGGKGPGPVPTPTLLSGSDLFYFSPLPSWGTVSLDGQPLPHVPAPIVSNEPPVRLPHGRHVLTWQAAPFEPQRCVLLVPPQQGSGQTCHITQAPLTSFADHAALITIPATLAQLPTGARNSLVQDTQSLLDTQRSQETVQPGERYALGTDPAQVRTATIPLQATMRFHLDTDPHAPANCSSVSLGQGCTIAGQDCHLFCTPIWPETPGAIWHIAAIFHTDWQYTTPDGQRIANTAQHTGSPVEQFITLQVTWTRGHLQVAFQDQETSSFDNPACIATVGTVGATYTYQFAVGDNTKPLSWLYASAHKAASGCIATTQVNAQSTFFSSPHMRDVLLLQRFGVLLAANDAAHRLWPSLPVADSYEQQLAQNLAQQVQ